MPKKAMYFTTPESTFIKHPKKIFFLHCCDPVLLCAFDAPNRVQFVWPKMHHQHSSVW